MRKKGSFGLNTGALIILILMLIIGCLCGYGYYWYARSMRSTIFMFKEPYLSGTVVTGDMFVPQEIDSRTYQAMSEHGNGIMYASQPELVEIIKRGDVLKTDVIAGLPVTSNLFMSVGGTDVERRLSRDNVAVEIKASKVSGLSGKEVTKGSRINISSFYAYDDLMFTDLLFQDLLILAVINDEDGNVSSVFVELPPADSIILQHALEAEKVSVGILKPGQYTGITEGTEYKKLYREEDPHTQGGSDILIGSVGAGSSTAVGYGSAAGGQH